MTDDLDLKLDDFQSKLDAIAALPDVVQSALDRIGPAAPAFTPPPKPAAAPQPSLREARQAALDSYSPFDRDPTALEISLMSRQEMALVEEIRDGEAEDNVYARATMREQWESVWTAGAADRAARIDDYVASLAQQKAARELEASEARRDAKFIAEEDIRVLGAQAPNLTGAALIELAYEHGVNGMSDDALRGLGWGGRSQHALAAAKQRLVPVSSSRIAGLGYLTVPDGSGGELAYVPRDQDVDEFKATYGRSSDPAPSQPAGASGWRHDDGFGLAGDD